MQLTMMTICLSNGLIRPHQANGVFNNDPTAGEGGVIGYVFGRTGFATRFFTRRMGQRVQVMDTLVATVADSAYAGWQALKHSGVFDQLDIGQWPRSAVGNIHNLARVLVNAHLAFERMRFLLTAVERITGGCLSRTLNFFLKPINHHPHLSRTLHHNTHLPTPLPPL